MDNSPEIDPKSRWKTFQRFQKSLKVEQARRYLAAVEPKAGQELIRQRCGLAMLLIHGFALEDEVVVDLLQDWEVNQDQVPKVERIVNAVRWAQKKPYDGQKGDRLR